MRKRRQGPEISEGGDGGREERRRKKTHECSQRPTKLRINSRARSFRVRCPSPSNPNGNPASKTSPTPLQPRSQAQHDHELSDDGEEDEKLERRLDSMSSANEGEAD